jgi:hypothetical protein
VQQVKEYAKRRHTTNGGCIKQGEQVHYNRKKKLILTDICQCPILSQQQNYVQYKPYSQDQKFNPLQITLKLFFIFLMKLNVKEPEIPKSAIENQM